MNHFEEAWNALEVWVGRLNVVAGNVGLGGKDPPMDIISVKIEDVLARFLREEPCFQQFQEQLVRRWKEEFGPVVHAIREVNWPELA